MPISKSIKRPLGVVLYRGNSSLARGRYVVIAIFGDSANQKTGEMIQVYVLVDRSAKPTEIVKKGDDEIVCGDCPLRGDGDGSGRACYVNLGQGARMVHETYRRGGYLPYRPAEHDQFFAGRMIRWGAYGEPVLIPLSIVSRLSAIAAGWTGYTHQWSKPEFQAYRPFFMASVHADQHIEAAAVGWRFFHSSMEGEQIPGTFICPASEEAGKRMTCFECGACYGNGRPVGAPAASSVRLKVHGGFGVMAAARNLEILAT